MQNFNRRALKLKTSGVFKNRIDELGNLIINQVTLIGNLPDSKHYDSFYAENGVNATFFEVWKGNECKTFSDGLELKTWVRENANFHNENPNSSIIL